MTLWRINIKTAAKEGFDPREYCLKNNILGVGWGIHDQNGGPPRNFDHYCQIGQKYYADDGDSGWWVAINAVGKRVQEGDLCWTRDWNGAYYIGEVVGPWQYLHDEEAVNHDIHNVRPCDWRRVGLLDSVPGAVERSFGPARTIQRVNDEAAEAYSRYVYARLTGRLIDCSVASDKFELFGLLSPLDHEDLAALYLQAEGYLLVPSTVKSTTAAYEWVMLHKKSGEKAVIQVKSGNARVDLSALSDIRCHVFLAIADGMITDNIPPNVTVLDRGCLLDFALENRSLLPDRILHYMDWIYDAPKAEPEP